VAGTGARLQGERHRWVLLLPASARGGRWPPPCRSSRHVPGKPPATPAGPRPRWPGPAPCTAPKLVARLLT